LLVLTNPAYGSATYEGFQIEIVGSLPGHRAISASFTGMRSLAPTNPGNSVLQNDPGFLGNLGVDPNTLILARSTPFFDRGYVGKFSVVSPLPRGFRIGIVGRYYDGLPFGRLLLVTGLNQAPFLIRATPRDTFPKG